VLFHFSRAFAPNAVQVETYATKAQQQQQDHAGQEVYGMAIHVYKGSSFTGALLDLGFALTFF
jgi:hypothetical protein